MKMDIRFSVLTFCWAILFSSVVLADKHEFSLAIKPGLLAGGIEGNFDLGAIYLTAGVDLELYIAGACTTFFVGAKKYFTESFFARWSLAYIENRGKHLWGAGPGADFSVGNTWRSGSFIYGGEWVGGSAYYDNIKRKMSVFIISF